MKIKEQLMLVHNYLLVPILPCCLKQNREQGKKANIKECERFHVKRIEEYKQRGTIRPNQPTIFYESHHNYD